MRLAKILASRRLQMTTFHSPVGWHVRRETTPNSRSKDWTPLARSSLRVEYEIWIDDLAPSTVEPSPSNNDRRKSDLNAAERPQTKLGTAFAPLRIPIISLNGLR